MHVSQTMCVTVQVFVHEVFVQRGEPESKSEGGRKRLSNAH